MLCRIKSDIVLPSPKTWKGRMTFVKHQSKSFNVVPLFMCFVCIYICISICAVVLGGMQVV